MSVRTVSVRLAAEIAGYVTNLRQAGQATRELSGELETLAQTSKDKFNTVTKSAAVVGVALTVPLVVATKAAAEFDHEMSAVSSVMNKAGLSAQQQAGQLDALRLAALKAGKDAVYSATQAAQAEEELTKAGVSVANILGGGLSGALSLASAGSLDLASAATDAAQAMNIFGLQGSAVPHIADVLTAAANTSATDVGKLAMSLNQAGLVAHQTGLSLEETAGALADFAQNGLVGQDAGTSFKTMLQALQAPSGKTADLMDKLGISAYDASGKFIGITALAQNLHDKLGPLSAKERDYALAQIFGNDAVRAANVLYQDGAAGLQKWIDGVQQQGIAADTARTKMNNLSGDVEQLRGSLETLAITSGTGANQGLRVLTQTATGAVNALLDMPAPLQETLTLVAGISGITLLAGTGFVKLRASSKEFLGTLTEMGPAGAKAATLLGKIGSFAGKASLIGAGAFLAYDGLHALGDYLYRNSGPVARDVDKMTDAFSRFAATGEVTGEMAKTFGIGAYGIGRDITALTDTVAKLNAENTYAFKGANRYYTPARAQQIADQGSVAQAKVDFGTSDQALTNLVNNGQTAQAKIGFDQFASSALAAGKTIDWVNQQFPGYTKAAGDAALANTGLAQGFASASEGLGVMQQGLAAAVASGQTLVQIENSLNGASVSLAHAQDDMYAAFDNATASVKKNGKTLNETTAAGRANREALLAIVDASTKAADATLVQTGSLDDANAVLQVGRDKFIKMAMAMGDSSKKAHELADQLFKIPSVSPTVTVPGLQLSRDDVRELNDGLLGLPKNTTLHVTTKFTSSGVGPVKYNRYGGVYANAVGGVYQHAADGVLNQASVYSTMYPARYAFAEPQTGGEAFVPRYGGYARSTQIIDTAARWYGGRFVPNSAGHSGTATLAHGAITTTYNVYSQRADYTVGDLQALTRQHEARMRVGRPR